MMTNAPSSGSNNTMGVGDANNGNVSSGNGNGGNLYGLTPEQATREFDALRREATKLERHLEDRVARYQQLAQRLTMGDNSTSSLHHHHDDPLQRSSLLDSAESGSTYNSQSTLSFGNATNSKDSKKIDEEEATLSKEIHRTMATMTELINTRMAPAAERTGRSQHALLVKRYREILFDCGADFNKTCSTVARRREAMELFRGATVNSGGEGQDPAMEQLLRERNAIDNSMKSATSVLNQAASVRTELRSQGASLRGVSGTMATILGNIPGVNTLIEKIRKKRQQDDRVVSGVVAGCILFTIWYLFG
mmetsp:Transcript_25382/g.51222  ORF Transcript_25382/g.51222 Transcript_25382/m.51222 type:complete len:307 (-) Transcript_25382:190-1110(-)